MARVLHVVPTLQRGGAERMLTNLVTAGGDPAREIQHRVAAVLGTGPLADEIEASGIPVDHLGTDGVLGPVRAVRGLARIVRDWRPDAIQGWLYYGDLAALAARGLAGTGKPRLYWSIRCSDLDMDRHSTRLRIARWLWARLSSRPDAIIANSHAGVAAHDTLGMRPRAVTVIHNGTNAERSSPDLNSRTFVRKELGLSDDALVAVHLARVDPQKDHGLLVRVAERLPEISFLAAGRGTKRLSGPANLLRLGDRADVRTLLNAGDIVLSTSAYGEGYPNAIAEGMACGLPAVSTDCGDVVELIGPCGKVVPRADADAFAAALKGLFALPASERADIGRAARQRILERFKEAGAIESFRRLYLAGELPEPPQDQVN